MTDASRITETIASIGPIDAAATERAWERLDSLTKPPRSLGRLEEIAARTGVPSGTVKSRLHHALNAARAAYDAQNRASEGSR